MWLLRSESPKVRLLRLLRSWRESWRPSWDTNSPCPCRYHTSVEHHRHHSIIQRRRESNAEATMEGRLSFMGQPEHGRPRTSARQLSTFIVNTASRHG